MKKVCPRCGKTFECCHNNILMCHCVSVNLNAEQLSFLSEHYSDCLCHDCLLAIKNGLYTYEIKSISQKEKND